MMINTRYSRGLKSAGRSGNAYWSMRLNQILYRLSNIRLLLSTAVRLQTSLMAVTALWQQEWPLNLVIMSLPKQASALTLVLKNSWISSAEWRGLEPNAVVIVATHPRA